MPPRAQSKRIAKRVEKAVQQPARREQRNSYESTDEGGHNNSEDDGEEGEDEDLVEWGQRLDGSSSSRTKVSASRSRRVTRGSGMTNKELYQSVIINGIEYKLGQTVKVKSFSDIPYLAVIFKMWENELGEKQVVARWLLKRSEIFLDKKTKELEAEPNELFYSNGDDLITPDKIIGPLAVLSKAEYEQQPHPEESVSPRKGRKKKTTAETRYFCGRYFNEHTAFVGSIDWSDFYQNNKMLDPKVDEEMFSKKHTKGKEAAMKAGREKAQSKRSRRSATAKTATTSTGKQKKPTATTKRRRTIVAQIADSEDNDEDEDDSDNDADYNQGNRDEPEDDEEHEVLGDIEEEDEIGIIPPNRTKRGAVGSRKTAAARSKRRATLAASTPFSTTTGTKTSVKRRKRLQDLHSPAVSATMLKRTSLMANQKHASITEGASVYEVARQRLHVSAVPETLPCREDEFAEIYGHLYNAIEERNSMCLYISGVPGTGKTATVHEVICTLKNDIDEGELQDFQYIELNGMKMTEPSQAYTQLWQAITGDKATPKHAAQLLEQHFSTPSPRRHTYVVLMDELDLLVTKSQSIMYNFFDWPHRPHAKLIVVAIANTMDLPERMLQHKVSSRLGLTRINFQPYTHQQLMTIVQSRLEGCEAFDADAVELCARKISAVSGDARRALDVCRRAVEMVEARWIQDNGSSSSKNSKRSRSVAASQQQHLVTMMVIDKAVKEMYASGHISFIQNASTQQKIFLVALRAAIRKAGLPEVSLGDVAFVHRQLCQLHELMSPSYEQIAKICSQLGAARCILAEAAILDVHQQIRLAVAEDDITVALRPDPFFSKIATS